eukprot:62568-Hanusia_phi.AAC.1
MHTAHHVAALLPPCDPAPLPPCLPASLPCLDLHPPYHPLSSPVISSLVHAIVGVATIYLKPLKSLPIPVS